MKSAETSFRKEILASMEILGKFTSLPTKLRSGHFRSLRTPRYGSRKSKVSAFTECRSTTRSLPGSWPLTVLRPSLAQMFTHEALRPG